MLTYPYKQGRKNSPKNFALSQSSSAFSFKRWVKSESMKTSPPSPSPALERREIPPLLW